MSVDIDLRILLTTNMAESFSTIKFAKQKFQMRASDKTR